MLKKIIIQVVLMVLTLFIPLIAFFIPAYSLNCRVTTLKSKQWLFKIYVYLIFLLVLILFQECKFYAFILGNQTSGMIPLYFTHSIAGVFVIWGIFLVMFLGFETVLLFFAQKCKINGFNQIMIVSFIMTTVAYIIVELIKRPVMNAVLGQLATIKNGEMGSQNGQFLIEQVTMFRENYVLILFITVFIMVIITYAFSFRKYLFGFHISYLFTLVYALCFGLKYVPNMNHQLLGAYSTIVMGGFSLYLCKEVFFLMKIRGRNSVVVIILIVILYTLLPLMVLFVLGALLSFRVFKPVNKSN